MTQTTHLIGQKVIFAIAIFGLMPLAAHAQYTPSTPKKTQNVAATEKMSQPVSIGGLPEYSGKTKFVAGRSHQTGLGPQYQEQFIAMEPNNQVVDWYKSALSSYKWQIVSSDESRIQAKKSDGSTVSILAEPLKSKDGRTFVRINYHEYHIKGAGE